MKLLLANFLLMGALFLLFFVISNPQVIPLKPHTALAQRAVCPGTCYFGVACSSLGLSDMGAGFCPNDREWSCCSACSSSLGSQNPAGCYCNDKVRCQPGLTCTWDLGSPPGLPLDQCVNLGGGGPGYATPYAYPYPYPYPTPRYDITGTVFIDNNRNGSRDGGDGTYSGLQVRLSGNASATDTSNPGYAFNNLLCCRNYTVGITVPAQYAATTPSSVTTNLPGNRTINFGIVRIYTISGSVFNDVNKNYLKDAGEVKDWPANASFTANGGTMTTNAAAGTFVLGGNLFAGTYTLNYTGGIPAGYINRYPINGPPPNIRVTVPSCAISPANPNPAYAVTCTNGNASNVNFVITNSIPWMQSYGLDLRFDNGLTDIIPIAPRYTKFASERN